jgi:hypothetical protein
LCKFRQSISPIRTILVVCLLAAVPGLSHAQVITEPAGSTSQLPSQWTAAVEALASKIASLAGTSKAISLSVRNISSIRSSDAEAIRASLETDLAARRLRVESESSADAHAAVTLSEDQESYVWVAQVRDGETQQLAMITAPILERASGRDEGNMLTLESRMVWQQSVKFLDFAVVTTAGPDSLLIVLEPDRLAYYHSNDLTSWRFSQSVPISHPSGWPRDARDPRGSIDVANGTALLQGVTCSQILDANTARCDFRDQKTGAAPARIAVAGREEDETIRLDERCGTDSVILATGNGDWTQPDSIEGYLLSELGDAVPSGPPIEARGPVTSLVVGAGRGSARAVVHNLKTGEYEAYVVTPSCGH